jgi:hypothetical protein
MGGLDGAAEARSSWSRSWLRPSSGSESPSKISSTPCAADVNAANAAKSTASSSRERLRLLRARACYSYRGRSIPPGVVLCGVAPHTGWSDTEHAHGDTLGVLSGYSRGTHGVLTAHGMVRYGTRARRMKLGAGVEARHRDRRRQWMDRCRRPPGGAMGYHGHYRVLARS